jgi:hypothetical protein
MAYRGSRESMLKALGPLYEKLSFKNIVKAAPVIAQNPKLFYEFYRWRKDHYIPHKDSPKQYPAAFGWLAGEIAGTPIATADATAGAAQAA